MANKYLLRNLSISILSLIFLSAFRLGDVESEISNETPQFFLEKKQKKRTEPLSTKEIKAIFAKSFDYKSSKLYSQQQKQLQKIIDSSRESGDIWNVIKAYLELGSSLFLTGKNYKASAYYNNAIQLANSAKSLQIQADSYEYLGFIKFKGKDYQGALSNYLKSLKISKSNNLTKNLFSSYYNLSVLYKILGDFHKSERNQAQYKEMLIKHNDQIPVFRKTIYPNEDLEKAEFSNIQEFIDSQFLERDLITIQILNKVTGMTSQFEMPVGSEIKFDHVAINLRSCFSSPPEKLPEDKGLVEIFEKDKSGDYNKKLFFGWLFSSSPAISSLEHPFYDVRLVKCRSKNKIKETEPEA